MFAVDSPNCYRTWLPSNSRFLPHPSKLCCNLSCNLFKFCTFSSIRGYRRLLTDWTFVCQFLTMQDIFLRHHMQRDFEAHSAFYLMDTQESFSGGKTAKS